MEPPSSVADRFAGAVPLTGSFTAVTVTLMVSLSLVAEPEPVATMPPKVSVACSVICAEPL